MPQTKTQKLKKKSPGEELRCKQMGKNKANRKGPLETKLDMKEWVWGEGGLLATIFLTRSPPAGWPAQTPRMWHE